MRTFGEIKLKREGENILKYNGYEVRLRKLFEGAWEIKVLKDGDEISSKVLLVPLEELKLREIPAYVDLPVTIKFSPPFVLAPRERRLVYATLPINIEIVVEFDGEEITLEELSIKELKRAWFGEPQKGVLSYFYESSIFNAPSEWDAEDGLTLVPLDIKNEDDAMRSIERLLIDSYQLSIYLFEERLVSEVVEITVRNGEVELEYTDRPPSRDAVELKKGEESLRRKGLTRIAKRSLGLLSKGLLGG